MTTSSRTLAAVLAATLLLGCGDLAHSNPYDPETPVTLTIVGPDSIDIVQGESMRLSVQADPSFSHAPPTWYVTPSGFVESRVEPGQFLLLRDGHADTVASVVTFTATVGTRTVTKSIRLLRHVTGIYASFCDVRSRVSIGRVGETTPACPVLVDRGGIPFDAMPTLATVIIRNPAVARRVANTFNFTLLAPGSTYVVFSTRGYVDSLFVGAS